MSAQPLKVHESLDAYKRQIPFFNYPALFKQHEEDYLRIFKDVCGRGAYILQKDLAQFEENLKKFLNVKYAFGCSDGTNAIMIGLMALGVKPGDEIICSSHTYIATASAGQMLGAKAVPCDIGPDNMMCPKDVEKRITPKTKVIMPTQLNGRCCDMDALQAIADKHGILIAEDAAQALGAKYKGKCAGTMGKFGTFSFYPAKVLGCFGDGGAIVTNDDEIGQKLLALRDHGRDETGMVVMWGTNARLDNLQAAFLDFKLKGYPAEMERRRAIARMYNDAFKGMPQLTLPPGPDADPNRYDIYQNYELAADRRDELRVFLKDRGIGSIMQWAGTPVHKFPKLGFNTSIPGVDKFFERCLMIPMNMTLTDDDVQFIIKSIKEFYAQ
ncbi:MAG: DegT/DnrJ/EryC1/StrS family aminotransferase [Proteobacteria bacterium]|nr:DegT/DnrJ/EryC1/StrS family aminotransferase [Pseudomonadota bacterium]